MSRNEWKAYLRDSLSWLKAAENNLSVVPMAAYYESGIAVEMILKAVLCKCGELKDDLMRGNRGHNIEHLKQRIIERGCLEKSVFNKSLNRAIRNSAHANIPLSGEIFINTVKQRSRTRYPKDGIASSEYISPIIAKQAFDDAILIIDEIKNIIER